MSGLSGTILQEVDTSYLDTLLFDLSGKYRAPHSYVLQALRPNDIKLWCLRKARYGLPTQELLNWLTLHVGFYFPDSVIEIGAGQGDLGRLLGIPMSDNYCQTLPEVTKHYQITGQVPTNPPPEVEKLDAIAAIAKYKPNVVIGSWITQLYKDGDTHGSVYGPDEEEIIRSVDTYIHIGNLNPHGDKRILKYPHETIKPAWLVSRASDPSKNCIHIWKRK